MSIDVDTLVEAYAVLKQYIPHKEQQEAADALVSNLVDYLSDEDIKQLCASDKTLQKAYKEYGIEDDDYAEDDEEY